jgi:hypothetical protein
VSSLLPDSVCLLQIRLCCVELLFEKVYLPERVVCDGESNAVRVGALLELKRAQEGMLGAVEVACLHEPDAVVLVGDTIHVEDESERVGVGLDMSGGHAPSTSESELKGGVI